MMSLTHHVNRVKAKPHHIRKRVAFGTAFFVAAIIGVAWLGASLATNAFALNTSGHSFADDTAVAQPAAKQDNAALLAAPAAAGQSAQTAHIEIVDAPKPSTPTPAATTIPF